MKTAISRGVCALAFCIRGAGHSSSRIDRERHLHPERSCVRWLIRDQHHVLLDHKWQSGRDRSGLITPARATVVEGKGCTLLPGLIDSHTHIRSRQDLEQSLALGVTTDVSMLMDVNLFRAMKQEQQVNRANDRADLFSSGYAATAPGGHGSENGLSVPTIGDSKEAQSWVDKRIAEGSEFIKIIYENGGDTGQGGRPSIDRATLQALVVAAHARGKLAVVHIHSERQAFDAVEAGADGLAHLFSHGNDIIDPRFAGTVAMHHAFVIPTLSVGKRVRSKPWPARIE